MNIYDTISWYWDGIKDNMIGGNILIGRYLTVDNFLSIGEGVTMCSEAFEEARTIVTRLKYHCTLQEPPKDLSLVFQKFEDKEGVLWYFFPNRTSFSEVLANDWYQCRADVYVYACKILISLLTKYKESVACEIFSSILNNKEISPGFWKYKPYIPM